MKPKVKIGSVWSGPNSLRFKVNDVVTKSDEVWVFYSRVDNQELKYHCLEPAFMQRFTEYANES